MGQTIKVAAVAAVVITAFHRDVYAIANAGHRASETAKQKMSALIISAYGAPIVKKDDKGEEVKSGGPSFEQYRKDRDALKQLAKDKKLADDQWLRKPYCAAVVALYGKLPESTSPDAIRKQEERKAAADAVEAVRKARDVQAAKPGAPAGVPVDKGPTEAEQLESLITRIGLFKTLEACVRLMEADESTKPAAAHIGAMVRKFATHA